MTHATNFNVDLLRHGEAVGGQRYRGRTDDPLTPRGWEQMWSAMEDNGVWASVVTSPLVRCAQFARALAERHGLPLEIEARLREIDFGIWEGRTAEEIIESSPDAFERFYRNPWRHAPPGGESLACLRTRVLEAWRDLCARRRPALVISHGGPIRVILCHHLRWAPSSLTYIDVPHAARYRLAASATDVRATARAAP